jgi:hypothetical protein
MAERRVRYVKMGKGLVALFVFITAMVLPFSCKKNDSAPVENSREAVGEAEQTSSLEVDRSVSSWKSRLDTLSIAYYQEAAWGLSEGSFGTATDTSFQTAPSPLKLSAYGPEGELPSEVKEPLVWILFSDPVIPLSKIGESRDASSVFSISPEIEGSFRWYSTRMIVFQAKAKVLPQREYRVTVNESVQSVHGAALVGKTGFSFRSEELAMRSALPGAGALEDSYLWKRGGVPLDAAGKILVRFNYPVEIETVADYLKLRSEGYDYQVTFSRPDNSSGRYSQEELKSLVVLSAIETLPEDSDIIVALGPGARSRPDYIGRKAEQEIVFHTITPFKLLRHSTHSYSFSGDAGATNPLFLEFSHPVDKASLLGACSFQPEVRVAEDNITVWQNTVRLSGLGYAYNSEYLLTIAASVKDVYGRSLGSQQLVKVKIPEAASFANFPNTGTRMLESQFSPKIVFDYQNMENGIWKAGAIDDPYSFWPATALEPYPFPEVGKNVHHFEEIDLSPWLGSDGKGWVGFSWNFSPIDKKSGQRPRWGQRNLTLQVTDLGLTVRYAYNKVVSWVTSLSSGKAVSGARVTLMSQQNRIFEGTSDDSGLVVFSLEDGEFTRYFQDPKSDWSDFLRLQVEYQGDRIEFKPNGSHNLWRSSPLAVSTPARIQRASAQVFLFTDRGLYRPGEVVTFRGIDRTLQDGSYVIYEGDYTLKVKENRWRGKEIFESSGTTTASGGFYGEIPIPSDLEPGSYVIEYSRPGGETRLPFQVSQFERLKFQVGLSIPDRDYFEGDTVSAELSADYLAGGALNEAHYSASWTKEPAWFAPEGEEWKDYRFGPSGYDRRYFLSESEGVLGSDGKAMLRQATSPEGIAGQPQRYRGEARVDDAGGQMIAARTSVIVHPAAFYIGGRMNHKGWSGFVRKGEDVDFDWALVRPDGRSYRDDVKNLNVELFKRSWKRAQQQGVAGRINTHYEMVLEPVERQTPAIGGENKGSVTFTPASSGSFLVRFSASDAADRLAVTELSFYATGSDIVSWGFDSPEMIGLETDRPSYAPGDTATILVKSPLAAGDYLITVEREGIFDERIVHLDGSANVIGVPISEEFVPVVYVAVSSYSIRTKKPDHSYLEPDLDKPKGYFGVVPVMVDTDSKRFDIDIRSEKGSYRPGEEAVVHLKATNKAGDAVPNAEITFLAVDRGVLDLIDYHVPDPLDFFYDPRKFPIAVSGGDSRSLLIDPVTYEVKDLQGGGGENEKMERREDFRPLAVFEPYVTTDEKGEAVVRFTLPDTLTTYRCTAVGVKENQFGRNEQELVAQNPVNVQSVLPELLRHRDTMEGGVIVSNLGSEAVDMDVTVSSTILGIEGETSRHVHVEGGKTNLVNFLFSAPVSGKGKISFTVSSPVLNEELVREVEVQKPAVFESVATGNRIVPENGKATIDTEMIRLPGGDDQMPDPEGSLAVSLSASKLALFEGAVSYLLDYPYDCFEQRTSKLIPYLLFGETGAFPSFEELALPRSHIAEQLREIGKVQTSEGGIPYWGGSRWANYYVSARTAQIIALAKNAGYPIPDELDEDALLSYLRKPRDTIKKQPYLYVLGLYARALLGDDVRGESETFRRRGDEIGIAGYALSGLASFASGDQDGARSALTRISSFIRPSARSLDITETWESGASWYGSEIERLSLLLMLIQRVDPSNSFRELALESLIQRRRSARWTNTVDNGWALIAASGELGLDKAPDIDVTVRIADNDLLSGRFDSIANPPVERIFSFDTEPLSGIERGKSLPLSVEASGEGTLAYRFAMRYSIPAESAPPMDMGIGVLREFFDMEGRPVSGDCLTAGETYRVVVHLSSPLRHDFLAVRVPVPSGAVILDTGFVTTARYEGYDEPSSGEDTVRNVSPDRSVYYLNEGRFFFDRFPQGTCDVSFMIRAVRPGVYPTPPAQAECMYEPEVFGRDGGTLIFIDERS